MTDEAAPSNGVAGLPDRRVDGPGAEAKVGGGNGPFIMSTYAATTPLFGSDAVAPVSTGRIAPSRRPASPGPMDTLDGLPSLAALEAQSPTFQFIGPMTNPRQAREWALVLQSQQIAFTIRYAWAPRSEGMREGAVQRGMVLEVRTDDYEDALHSIDLYERENENWPPPRDEDPFQLHPASSLLPLVFLGAALFFVSVTGPSAGGSAWFGYGRADASRLFTEPWRMVTALTLHADGSHIFGNAVSGSIFGSMLSRRIGPGAALLGFVLAGALGNAFNAIHHLAVGHFSIGASTAVFGAIGILAGIETIRILTRRRRPQAEVIARRRRYLDIVAPIVGGLTLLGTLGAGGGNTDVWAHGYGFIAGVGLGALAGLWLRRHPNRKPSVPLQLLASSLAVGLIVGAWSLALP